MWKTISDNYEVSDSGVVRNIKKNRELKPSRNLGGYCFVNIKGKSVYIHRLVAEMFIPKIDGKSCVNHKDGNKSNNAVENLEWCTYSENMAHAFKIGIRNNIGINNPKCKLRIEQVEYIKENYKPRDKEYGSTAIGKKFGVSRQAVESVAVGKSWVL